MKKLLYLIFAAVLFQACSNDFDVVAPWKEITVGYGILAPRDTAHYVRIEKAFLDPTVSALEVAQIVDSLYFDENAITVWLERVTTKEQRQMMRVDGNLEGHVRAEGVFANQPNWLYKIKNWPLVPGEEYRLVIKRTDGRPEISATTAIPKDFSIVVPNPADIVRRVAISNSNTTTVSWRCDENGVFFNVFMTLPFREETPNGTVVSRDTIVWEMGTNVERNANPVGSGLYAGVLEAPGSTFFRLLADELTPLATNFRYFEKASIKVVGGGKEIKEFNITAAANSGLTGAEVFPTYTNFTEGLGVLTAKNEFVMNNIQITTGTIDSLRLNPLTEGLKFRF